MLPAGVASASASSAVAATEPASLISLQGGARGPIGADAAELPIAAAGLAVGATALDAAGGRPR